MGGGLTNCGVSVAGREGNNHAQSPSGPPELSALLAEEEERRILEEASCARTCDQDMLRGSQTDEQVCECGHMCACVCVSVFSLCFCEEERGKETE
jgi:hypothetical protein